MQTILNYVDFEVVPDFFKKLPAKRCKWCYNIIKNEEGTEIMGGVWCSKDCQQEEEDWNFIKKLMTARKKSRIKWRETHPVKKVAIDRKEYLKEYDAKRKEKRRDSVNKGMIKYRARKKLLTNIK